jgi:23S rRNA pseudouridine2604 synthase
MRLNKFIADAGICSRREADAFIRTGRVVVNGKRADMGMQVSAADHVRVDGRAVNKKPKRLYIAYHKPVGILCTTDRRKADNIIDALGLRERVVPVGRLDVASSGLILLTNDGDFANKMMHPRFAHEKEYDVTVARAIDNEALARMARGMMVEGRRTKRARIRRRGEKGFSITMTEGRNRQIRRMVSAIGNDVVALKRVRIGKMRLGRMRAGEYRRIRLEDVVGR